MKKTSLAAAACSVFAVIGFATAAAAQTWMPTGAELRGHSVNIDTNGQVSTVTFNPDGTARIMSATGREAQATWFTQANNICLQSGGARECWPYQMAFQSNVPVTLTSDCGSVSRWTPLSTEQLSAPRSGERG